ncbi:hypothetical protein [Sphaerisporangium sp. NPDC051011]
MSSRSARVNPWLALPAGSAPATHMTRRSAAAPPPSGDDARRGALV